MAIKAVYMDVLPQVVRVQRWVNNQWEEKEDLVSREVSVEVRFPTGSCRLWAWPEDLRYLAHGHAVLDCMHQGPSDSPIADYLKNSRVEEAGGIFNVVFCDNTDQLQTATPADSDPGHIKVEKLMAYMTDFMSLPGLWHGTGCFHRAGMINLHTGEFIAVVEDIGRHNCLDRIMGIALAKGLNPAGHALLISARITASLYSKARRAGFNFIVSRAAITTSALSRATSQNITLVGFCRPKDGRLTIFADAKGRIRS